MKYTLYGDVCVCTYMNLSRLYCIPFTGEASLLTPSLLTHTKKKVIGLNMEITFAKYGVDITTQLCTQLEIVY